MNTIEIIKRFEKKMNVNVFDRTREQNVVATRAAIYYYLVNYKNKSLSQIRRDIQEISKERDNKKMYKNFPAPTEATIYNGLNNYKKYRNKYPLLDDEIRCLAMEDIDEGVKVRCIADVLTSKSHLLDKNAVSNLFHQLNILLDLKNNI